MKSEHSKPFHKKVMAHNPKKKKKKNQNLLYFHGALYTCCYTSSLPTHARAYTHTYIAYDNTFNSSSGGRDYYQGK